MSQPETSENSLGAEPMPPSSMATVITGIFGHHLGNFAGTMVDRLAEFVSNVGDLHPEISGLVVNWAATALQTRYDQLRDIQDLENAISCHRYTLRKFHRPGHPYCPLSVYNLAHSFRTRYDKFGIAQDLENCILFYSEVLNINSPIPHPSRPSSLNNLANALRVRYDNFGNTKDLEDSVLLHTEALNLCPPGNPDHQISLNNLALSLHARYKKFGNVKDLEDSVLFHTETLDLCPPGHPDRPHSLNNLSNALGTRYGKFSNAKDLEDSILFYTEALNLCPPGHSDRPATLKNLGNALGIRYDNFGNTKDLEDSVLLHTEALDLCPPGHPNRQTSLDHLANDLRTCYNNFGNTKDLEDSVLLHSEALNLCPPGHPNRQTSLDHLATDLRIRYDNFGNTKDLEDSVLLHIEALNLCPPGHPDRQMSLNNLAISLRYRYDKYGNAKDLQDSVLFHTEALSLCSTKSTGHHHQALLMNNLAGALSTCYNTFGSAKCLEDSILLYTEALNLCPPGNPNRQSSLINLAMVLTTRYDDFGNAQDLEDSILLHTEALNSCPPDHPERSMSFILLARLFMTRHQNLQMRKVDDLAHSFLYFEQGACHSTSYIHRRLIGACDWVRCAHAYHHETIFTAYTATFQLINHSLIFHPNVETQQNFLASHANIPRSLASNAASAAVAEGKIELAVEFLEQGRALLWSRVDAYKHPLNKLRQVTGGNKLADRLEVLSTKLEHLSLVSSSATINHLSSTRATNLDRQMKEHRILSEEWDDLVGKVREIDGFSHFLRVAPFDDLRLAAAEGPVILVNISKYRSDAIILLKDDTPVLVNLPEVLLTELHDQKCGSAKEIASTLAYLWDTIVSPIVDRLSELEVAKGSRIWWCPTAELCALPLHAAGRGKKNLHELYISSYTPTLSSLIRARSNIIQPPAAPKLLVVGQPSNDLKKVRDEVDIIQEIRPDVDVLFGPSEATREAVLESLKDHSWVHFACHGLLGDKGQPFHTSFKLHEDIDRRLQLLDLIQARLPNAELAFLSACHSAAGGLSTPDESIHLSAALQFCGFKSVIGTLWEMNDEDGPTISEKFYKYMFRNPDKIDFRDSAHALNSAIKEMRKEKVPLDRLAMFVHIGA